MTSWPSGAPVVAVVVSYRTPQLLLELLEILAGDAGITRIVVVDNNSGDDTVAMIKSADLAKVDLISLDANLGFAKAVNLALRHAPSGDVLLINPDCHPAPGSVDVLRQHVADHPRCAIAAPMLVHPVRRLGSLAAGRQPTTRSLFNHYSGLSAVFPGRSWALGWQLRASHHADSVRAVEWASGACLLVRRQVMDDLGGLDERWFMYAEDMDLCRRAIGLGFEVHHVPQARMSHVIGASSASTVSTRWVSVMLDYHATRLSRSRGVVYVARGVLALGLAGRSAQNLVLSVLRGRGGTAADYRREARKNLAWAATALSPETNGLDQPPGMADVPKRSAISRRKRSRL